MRHHPSALLRPLMRPALRRVSLPATLALLAATMLLAACSDESPDEPSAPVAVTSTSEAPAATPATEPPTASGTTGATATPEAATKSPGASPTAAATSAPSPAATAATTPAATAPATSPPAPPAVREPGPVRAVAAYGNVTFRRPVDVAAYPLGGFDLVVAEQGGQLMGLGTGGAETLLNLSARMQGGGNEEGLLSVALDPAFATNSHVWVYYSNTASPRRTVVARFTASADGMIDAATELVVLEVPQPFGNHNGGALRFGPDGMLYLGIGDGGSGGDPQGHGQNLGTLLGTVIRIDVRNASASTPYQIPADNPFVGVSGARDEIWAYGLRNPWRMSFDPATGMLWLGDVGQNRQEEVNRIAKGGNYGWNIVEGSLCFGTSTCDRTGLVAPLAVYDLGSGRCAVTGGVVARNAAAGNVEGHYLFGDYCSGDLWALATDTGDTDGGADAIRVASGLGNIASINQVDGEIYLVTFNSPLLRLVDP